MKTLFLGLKALRIEQLFGSELWDGRKPRASIVRRVGGWGSRLAPLCVILSQQTERRERINETQHNELFESFIKLEKIIKRAGKFEFYSDRRLLSEAISLACFPLNHPTHAT